MKGQNIKEIMLHDPGEGAGIRLCASICIDDPLMLPHNGWRVTPPTTSPVGQQGHLVRGRPSFFISGHG